MKNTTLINMAKLIIKLKGGTGNQLFQAAAAVSLAHTIKKNCQFCIDNISKNKYKRKLEIFELLENLNVKEKKSENSNKIIYLDEYDIDHPLYFSKNSPLASLKNDIQLEGYFTNYRIHNPEVKEKIKAYVSNLEYKENFQKLDFIAIHLRELHGTGDSEIEKNIDNIQINYYSEALGKITKASNLYEIKYAFVFCDMWKNPQNSKLLPQIKDLLKRFGINYINGDKEIKSTLDILKIFSLSKCCVISNSTLSWWGAYLSNGKVFCPVMNLWEPDLKIPDHWEQIYSGEIRPLTHHKKYIFQTTIQREKVIDYRIYNQRRLLTIRIYRAIIKKIKDVYIYKILNKFLSSLGLLKENPNKTFS
tara:strand:- start:3558 stop:4643 length:1086 start_codon:yes stop_codon:yes gene_type:complete